MTTIKKAWGAFSAMPRTEKITVAILAAIVIFSLGQFVSSRVRFPVLGTEKGLFAEGFVGHVKTLNPVFVDFNDADRDISMLIFSGLIRYDPLQKNFFPDLAVAWERSSNGLIYTFHMRTDALWHDSVPVTADDVLFTFHDVIQDPGFKNTLLKNAFEGVAVKKTDPNTVTFTLPKPNSYFITNLTTGILPKHALENAAIANLEKSSFGLRPIGSGPYMLTSLKLNSDGDTADLAAFSPYYGQKPTIEKIRFYTFPDEKTLIAEHHALHGIAKLNAETGGTIFASDSRFNNYSYSLNQFTALYLNTENPLLKDQRIRQALALALNKNELIGNSEKRVDALDLEDHHADPLFAYNTAAAAKIFDAAGLKLGPEGVRLTSKGEKLSLTLLTLSKIPKETAEKIKSAWQAIGIQITVQTAEGEDFARLANERRYGALLIRQNLGYNRDVYPLFHSSQIAKSPNAVSGLNFSNFKSFQTDGLTEAIRKEKDPKAKEKILSQLSKAISEQVPVIFLSTPVYSYLLDKRISPFPASSLDFHSDRFKILPYLTFPNL